MNKEKVIKEMERAIYYFIKMYQINPQDQEDVYQDCIEKILSSIDEYNPQKGTTINQFLMPRIRGAVKEVVRKGNKRPLPVDDIFIIDNSSVEQDLLEEEEQQTLLKAIEKLSKMQKKVIELKYLYGLSMSEIAVGLDIHYSTVAKHHHRGVGNLRKYLGN